MNALWTFVGGGLGSLARWGASGFVAARIGHTFPWGALVVNVTDSFIIGLFAALTGPEGRLMAPASFRQFLILGVCGGYTTFSSFSLQTLNLQGSTADRIGDHAPPIAERSIITGQDKLAIDRDKAQRTG